jgi:hypothetical protein
MHMTSHNATQRRTRAFLIGSLIALTSLLALAPAQAATADRGFVPVTGTWTRGGSDTVAWIDLATWKLVTSVDGGQIVADPQPQPWIPVAGDWDGDGVDTVQMFNVHTWQLLPAERGAVGDPFGPEPLPWFPVAGDWEGRGIDSVLVFDVRDGSLHKLSEGPIAVERYDPQPQPWLPVAGDWDGDRIDTIATYQLQATTPASAPVWGTVFGDWDRDGVDTAAALHMPTGTVVQPEPETLSTISTGKVASKFGKAFQMPNGCYWTIKNYTVTVIKFKYGVGGCMFVVMKQWEKWTCCPFSLDGSQVSCTMKLEGSGSTPSYSNC